MRCPCRKKSETTTYAECCQPYHDGELLPQTAEALMRSRYAAFALRKTDYLSETWHVSTRPKVLDLDPAQEWMLLRIKNAGTDGDTGWVEFEARSRIGGQSYVLRETSRFVFEDGRWFYVDGDISR